MSGRKTTGTALVRSKTVDLESLASGIREDFKAARAAGKAMVERLGALGDKLNRAKSLLSHGQWTAWVDEHCDFSLRSAQLYMRLAELPKSARVALSTIQEGLDKLAPAPPEPVRELPSVGRSTLGPRYIPPQAPDKTPLRTSQRIGKKNVERLDRALDKLTDAFATFWRTVSDTRLRYSLEGRRRRSEYQDLYLVGDLLLQVLRMVFSDDSETHDFELPGELVKAAKACIRESRKRDIAYLEGIRKDQDASANVRQIADELLQFYDAPKRSA